MVQWAKWDGLMTWGAELVHLHPISFNYSVKKKKKSATNFKGRAILLLHLKSHTVLLSTTFEFEFTL